MRYFSKKVFVLGLVFSIGQAGADTGSSDSSATMDQLGGSEEAIRMHFGSQAMQDASAVQKRFFPKTYRHQLSLRMGTGLTGEPYLDVQEATFAYRFYIFEWLGVGGTYSRRFRQLNSAYQRLREEQSTTPFVIAPKDSFGGEVIVTPIYAKMNFFGMITRLEVYTEVGYHQYRTTRAANHALYSAGGIRFMPLRWMSFSFGISNYFFNEKRRLNETKLRNIISFNGGVSAWFPFWGYE